MTRLITAQKPVSDLVQEFAEGDLAIPEIQRDVVWKPDQFKKLVSSIFCQYPCGSLIFWEPRERDVSLVKSMIKPERLKQYEGRLPKYFLLDGQQRLTALASVILERDRLKTLLAEVEEDMPYIFCNLRRFFRNTEHSPDDLEASTDDSGYTFPWVSLHDVLDGDFSQREDIQRKLPPDKLQDIRDQAQRFRSHQFPIQIIQERTYDDVAEIFARVNSLGTPLTGAEIHLARLVPHWKGIAKEFRDYRRELRDKKYDLDLSFLMRTITAIECDTAQIAKLTQKMHREKLSHRHLQRAWNKARHATNHVIQVLDKYLDLDRSQYLPSKNALIPLVYYLAREKSHSPATRQMLRFFLFSQLSERYGGAAETVFRTDFRVLTDEDDTPRQNLEDLARAAAADARQYYRGLKIRPSDVSGIPTKNVVLLIMYVLMQNNRARDWGTEQPALLRDIEPQEMHVHHIFPFNFMAKDKNARAYAEQEELNPSEFRASINDIANLTFLSDASNTRIGDKRPQEYLPEWTTKETRRAHFIPEDSSLWTPKRYGEFLAARRALIAKAATRLLSKLR